MNLIFATNNPHKLLEIQNILGDSFRLTSLKDLNFIVDIPEDQDTLEGNALQKAKYIYSRFHQACFADDTGLEVDTLDGKPGVHSARFSGAIQEFGSEIKRSEANVAKLLHLLEGKTNRDARFRTVIAYISSSGEEFLFDGIVNGKIIHQKRGSEGFGYDPVFVPEAYQQTFAEMDLNEKNKVSHRARAFHKFREFLHVSNTF
jgi:XTP/dITP diphosphohydrolase